MERASLQNHAIRVGQRVLSTHSLLATQALNHVATLPPPKYGTNNLYKQSAVQQ